MNARERLRRARAVLIAGVAVCAVLWAVAAGTMVLSLFAALEAAVELPSGPRTLALPLAGFATVAALGAAGWRSRAVRSREAVALWIESRVPSLRYALVTLEDARTAGAAVEALEARVEGTTWRRPLSRALARALAGPAALAAAAILVLALLPPAAVARVGRPRLDADLTGPVRGRTARAPLAISVAVTPPAYTGERAFTLEDPAVVAAVSGSRVAIDVRSAGARLAARLGDSALAVGGTGGGGGGAGGRRTLAFAMPARPAALRFLAEAGERIVAIEPRPDSAPTVTLTLPDRDSVLRTATGVVPLSAEFADDYGLAAAWFEFIISSGERESFTFRSGVLARAALDGARRADRRAALALDSLRLRPGDVMHLRAVATDRNDATGPGRGVSATRTFRVARAGEYDSIAVEGLPLFEGDTAAISQRMLIMLAEALERRRPRLARDVTVREARDIGRDQARLRRRVSDIIFARLGDEPSGEHAHAPGEPPDEDQARRANLTPEQLLAAADSATTIAAGAERPLDFAADETPVVAINRPLLEAYNAMWEAGRWLEIGEPDDALPHMRAALAAIQRARQAERLYLRGRPPTVVVDLAAARLAGDRSRARSGGREPRGALGWHRARLAARLDAALSAASGSALVDSLLLLRLDALDRWPGFAAALGRAVADLRAGRDATIALVRAREAVAGESRASPGLPAWEMLP